MGFGNFDGHHGLGANFLAPVDALFSEDSGHNGNAAVYFCTRQICIKKVPSLNQNIMFLLYSCQVRCVIESTKVRLDRISPDLFEYATSPLPLGLDAVEFKVTSTKKLAPDFVGNLHVNSRASNLVCKGLYECSHSRSLEVDSFRPKSMHL